MRTSASIGLLEAEMERLQSQRLALHANFMGPRECAAEKDLVREIERLDAIAAAMRARDAAA